MTIFPVGERVPGGPAAAPSRDLILEGRTVTISQMVLPGDANALYTASHGDGADPGQWTYMSFGPFDGPESMHAWLESLQESADPLFFVVRKNGSQTPLGMISLLNIELQHRRIELGNIWYVPEAQRSAVSTETIYLLLRECFDRLGFRRVEWKCDALNNRSRAAARRLGFLFEGIFRHHYINKGRNRDTAWYAMLDDDWPRIRKNFEYFLYDPECSESLGALNV